MRSCFVVLFALAACSDGPRTRGDAATTDDAQAIDSAPGDDATPDDADVDAAIVDAAVEIDAAPISNDPFDPASCGGIAWTGADAFAHLAGAPRAVLASATIQVRTRTCPNGVCGAWSPNANWLTHFLTYSGGVVTRYKDLQADTRLVLYADAGAAKLSLQHVTFTQGGYADSHGIVYSVPPTALMYPKLYAVNVVPASPNDYEDLELTLKNGVLVLGANCARFTANQFGTSEPFTTEYAALYRW